MYRRILSALTFPCLRITEMVEKKEVTGLSFTENVRYKLHVLLCKVCKSYLRQSHLIDKALKRMFGPSRVEKKELDEAAKEKILEQIRNAK